MPTGPGLVAADNSAGLVARLGEIHQLKDCRWVLGWDKLSQAFSGFPLSRVPGNSPIAFGLSADWWRRPRLSRPPVPKLPSSGTLPQAFSQTRLEMPVSVKFSTKLAVKFY